jgi:ectoine hydroxylase-related dioxygenase (phytanoyl-CoA dioxygenase family)
MDVDAPCWPTVDEIDTYRSQGFVHLRAVLSPDTLRHYARDLSARVEELNVQHRPMDERTTYEKAFLQVMNLWRRSARARQFVLGKRLAGIAAALLEVPSVRLYHDQALYKEPGGGATPWHADHYYWPLSSDRCCTAWIPLQATPLPMGPLAFAAGSQRLEVGRDLPISDESEAEVRDALAAAGIATVEEPFDLGDVSFHSSRTFHRAGPNRTSGMRQVMTIIYMDAEMRLVEPRNANQERDRIAWCPGAAVGQRIETPLNPILYP